MQTQIYCIQTPAEIPVIGDKLGRKKDNMIRFYFENLNGICSHDKGMDKEKFFSSILNKLEVDCFGAAETNLNWKMTTMAPWNLLLDLSPGTKNSFVCNENEAITLKQQGGTCITMMEKYGQYVTEMGKDETGLSRWTWIQLKGNNGISTRIIAAYIPCRARKSSLLSTYAQQTRFWNLKGENQCARKKREMICYNLYVLPKKLEIRLSL